MTITALPDPPSRGDPANFRLRADAFLGALPDFATEANARAAAVNADADAAAASAAAAAVSETAAEAAVTAAGNAGNAPKWVSGTAYAEGDCAWSPTDYQTYRRKSAGGGATDPAADSANWARLAAASAWVIKTGNCAAADGDRFMCNTSGGAFTATLPAGAAGKRVVVADYAGTWGANNLTVARDGSDKIMGLAESLVCGTNNAVVTLEYVDATQGWRIV